MFSIAIVEDDENLRLALADNLELEGYSVTAFSTIESARKYLSAHKVDLAILDVMLPDGNGFELCQALRSESDILILMLTALSMENDVIEGFVSGADDYLSKPYRTSELLLRIKALLNRKRAISTVNQSQINGFVINWPLREITLDGAPIHLTKTAFDILQFLFNNLNKTCSRDMIPDAVWGKDVYVDNRTVDNFISQLKKSLHFNQQSDFQIKTIRGIGYSLVKK